ncbi:MAG: hypothetical protein JST92_12550 [Deltaproteobacteria bacterium]|nr:hypothetical protein [Deltaproteobacteria bacterium]
MKSLTTLVMMSALLLAATRARAEEPAQAEPPKGEPVVSATHEAAPASATTAPADKHEPRPDDSKSGTVQDDLAAPAWSAITLLGSPIRFAGYFWTDTGYLVRKNVQAGAYDQNASYMNGRFVLSAAYGRSWGNLAALARVEYLGLVNEFSNSQYEPHTLDAYLKVGTPLWDVQLGRFLAWEVYYRGQGIELYTAEEAGVSGAPTLYLLDYTRGLTNEPGQAAFHLFPFKWLSFELAGEYGQQSGQTNYYGIRPVVDLKVLGFELIGGVESQRQLPQTSADKTNQTLRGYAARLEYALPIARLGVDLARTDVRSVGIDGLIDTSKTLDKTSVGGFVDLDFWRNSVGLGLHFTTQVNQRQENNQQIQAFVSYLLRLPIEGLSVKAVYGFARGHFEDASANAQWENTMNSVRVRVMYDFR